MIVAGWGQTPEHREAAQARFETELQRDQAMAEVARLSADLAAARDALAAERAECGRLREESDVWRRAAWSYRNGNPHHLRQLSLAMVDPSIVHITEDYCG